MILDNRLHINNGNEVKRKSKRYVEDMSATT